MKAKSRFKAGVFLGMLTAVLLLTTFLFSPSFSQSAFIYVDF
jgi:hypothetical protein